MSRVLENFIAYKKTLLWANPTTGDIQYDRPTMLFVRLPSINPTKQVGVSGLKKQIGNATLAAYSHAVIEILDAMSAHYDRILELGKTNKDFLMNTFDSLLTNNNEVFQHFN